MSKDASDGYFILSFFVGLFGGMIVAGLKQPRCNFWKAVLAARTVEVFTGKTAADRYSIPFNRIAEGIHEGETGQYEVEILPGSSLMYRINGHPVTTPIPAIVSSVVALRSKPYSPRVPDVWRGPDLSSSQELRHRHLSSEEKEELGEQISRLSRFRWEFRGFYLLFIVLGIAHKIASPHVASVLMPLVFIGLLTLDFKRYGSPGGLRAHLVDDLSDGKLFIVSETDLGKEQVELEILPHSNAIWSANGVPGGWRLFR
ncbi:MAG: hypothetical protein HY074_05490 [Deltaproteobacteria bacterium]|nr:hypothetical protein [Deltaproteobacteria bacterium]